MGGDGANYGAARCRVRRVMDPTSAAGALFTCPYLWQLVADCFTTAGRGLVSVCGARRRTVHQSNMLGVEHPLFIHPLITELCAVPLRFRGAAAVWEAIRRSFHAERIP